VERQAVRRRKDGTLFHAHITGKRIQLSDDEDAAAEIGELAKHLGFSPIALGGLSEGGLLVQARGNSWGRLIFKDLVKFD
jgi:predicted dinucleotide-binding enzyme